MSTSRDPSDEATTMIALGPVLARSARFKTLFADGMRLVEEAASYLDGPGRDEAMDLSPVLADAYSAESMRLTTRLMQVASWLLVRRAVVDGEITGSEAMQDRVKVTLAVQTRVSPPSIFLQLPFTLQRLTERSLRLQRRVIHLDRMVNQPVEPEPMARPFGLAQQHAMLQSAYGSRT